MYCVSCLLYSRTCLEGKGYTETSGRPYTLSSQERIAAVASRIHLLPTVAKNGYQMVVNRGFWSPLSLHSVSFVRSFEESFRKFFSTPWRARGPVVSWSKRSVGVLSCSAPSDSPLRHVPPRYDPPVVCLVLFYRHIVPYSMIIDHASCIMHHILSVTP